MNRPDVADHPDIQSSPWAEALARRIAVSKRTVCGCGCGKAFLLFCTGDPAVDGHVVMSAAGCREMAEQWG